MILLSNQFENFLTIMIREVAGTEMIAITLLLFLMVLMGLSGRLPVEFIITLVLMPFIVAAAYNSDFVGVILLILLYLALLLMRKMLGR